MADVLTVQQLDLLNLILKQVASTALERLKANTVMTGLVNRNFENMIQNAGDTVFVPIPRVFQVNDLADGSTVVQQNPQLEKTQVVLNNHKYITWTVTDLASMLASHNVKGTDMDQAMANLCEAVDQSILISAYTGFTAQNPVGAFNTAISDGTARLVRERFVNARCPRTQRKVMVVSPGAYTGLLSNDKFTRYIDRGPQAIGNANNAFNNAQAGGGGTAYATGALGDIYGMEVFESQLVPITNTNETHNVAFATDALLFVQRPLSIVPMGMGAIQQNVSEDNLSIRVTLNYNSDLLAGQMTIDTLYGVGIGRNQFGMEVRS